MHTEQIFGAPFILHKNMLSQDTRLKFHLLEQLLKVSSDAEETSSRVLLADKLALFSTLSSRQAMPKTGTEKRVLIKDWALKPIPTSLAPKWP